MYMLYRERLNPKPGPHCLARVVGTGDTHVPFFFKDAKQPFLSLILEFAALREATPLSLTCTRVVFLHAFPMQSPEDAEVHRRCGRERSGTFPGSGRTAARPP